MEEFEGGGLGCRTVVYLLREAKIDQFEVAFSIYENVLRLHVSIRHSLLLMQKLQDQHNLSMRRIDSLAH